MTNQQIFDALAAKIKEDIPGFKVCYKTESWVSKILAVLVFVFNRRYMKDYTTTRYPKVYFPSREYVENDPGSAWKILAHEYVHLIDRKQHGPVFNFWYAMPQLLAVLSLSAISAIWLGSWGLFGLVFLLFLAPWPSRGRRDIELRGYTMSMAVNYWRYGSIPSSTKAWTLEVFTGWGYYRMWPRKAEMESLIDKAVSDIENEKDYNKAFEVVRSLVKD